MIVIQLIFLFKNLFDPNCLSFFVLFDFITYQDNKTVDVLKFCHVSYTGFVSSSKLDFVEEFRLGQILDIDTFKDIRRVLNRTQSVRLRYFEGDVRHQSMLCL